LRLEHLLQVVAFGLLATTPCLAEPLAPDDVASAFREFRELNARLAAPQDCECQSLQLREDMARYADGPLAGALGAALARICDSEDAEMLHALVGVTLATAEAAADTFAQALASAFICRPELLEKEFKASDAAQQRTLLDLLSLGFENATATQPDATGTVTLRARLHALPAAAD
jgi:hypothetical protein